jgi:hypothetical protein
MKKLFANGVKRSGDKYQNLNNNNKKKESE